MTIYKINGKWHYMKDQGGICWPPITKCKTIIQEEDKQMRIGNDLKEPPLEEFCDVCFTIKNILR